MIDFKSLFSFWSYDKASSEKLFKDKVKNIKYVNGEISTVEYSE